MPDFADRSVGYFRIDVDVFPNQWVGPVLLKSEFCKLIPGRDVTSLDAHLCNNISGVVNIEDITLCRFALGTSDTTAFTKALLDFSKVIKRQGITSAAFLEDPKKDFHERVGNPKTWQIVKCVE
jgi:hypothetical protein